MTSNDFRKFKLLAESLVTLYTNPYKVDIKYWIIEDAFNTAKFAFKRQNSLLKDGYPDDEVKGFSWFDESTNSVSRFVVKAKRKFTLIEWFSIVILNTFHASLQKAYLALNEFDFSLYTKSKIHITRLSA